MTAADSDKITAVASTLLHKRSHAPAERFLGVCTFAEEGSSGYRLGLARRSPGTQRMQECLHKGYWQSLAPTEVGAKDNRVGAGAVKSRDARISGDAERLFLKYPARGQAPSLRSFATSSRPAPRLGASEECVGWALVATGTGGRGSENLGML